MAFLRCIVLGVQQAASAPLPVGMDEIECRMHLVNARFSQLLCNPVNYSRGHSLHLTSNNGRVIALAKSLLRCQIRELRTFAVLTRDLAKYLVILRSLLVNQMGKSLFPLFTNGRFYLETL